MQMKFYDCMFVSKIRISRIYLYLWIVIGFIMIMIFISCTFDYEVMYDNYGIVVNNDYSYLVDVNVPLDEVNIVINNDYVVIDKHRYYYYVDYIGDIEAYLDNNYVNIRLFVSFESKYKINNLVVKMSFTKSKKKIISYIRDII